MQAVVTGAVAGRGGRSAHLQRELAERGIHFRLVKEYPFLERESVADVIALLHLAVNPHNDPAFRRMMNRPKRSLGARELSCTPRASLQDHHCGPIVACWGGKPSFFSMSLEALMHA